LASEGGSVKKLVLASKNQGKITELERILSDYATDIKVLGLKEFPNMPEVIESGNSLTENSLLKAKQISEFTGLPALADDSGLFVDALNGDPGVYSARWAQYLGDDARTRDRLNMEKVLSQLLEIPSGKRSAKFKTSVTFYDAKLDGLVVKKEQKGELEGEISKQPFGSNGFGYDPIFIPAGFDQTLAQLSSGQKDEISHRGMALRAITPYLVEYL
jgi:XTP/dITP diphosphohydrolase